MLKLGDIVKINLKKYAHVHGKIGAIKVIHHMDYGIIYTVRTSEMYSGDFTANTLIKIEPEQNEANRAERLNTAESGENMKNPFTQDELCYLIDMATENRNSSAILAEMPEQRYKRLHAIEVVKPDNKNGALSPVFIVWFAFAYSSVRMLSVEKQSFHLNK